MHGAGKACGRDRYANERTSESDPGQRRARSVGTLGALLPGGQGRSGTADSTITSRIHRFWVCIERGLDARKAVLRRL